MKKERATTLQQKLGFFDEDLKKPKHDELMLWLDANIERILDENIPKVLNCFITSGFKTKVEQHIKSAIIEYESRYARDYKNEHLEKIEYLKTLDLFNKNYERTGSIQVSNKQWEYPINAKSKQSYREYNGNIQTVGFVDMAVTYTKKTLPVLKGIKFEMVGEYSPEKKVVGINDEVMIDFKDVTKTIFIEVKTKIESLGELIRQINLYKIHNPGDYFVLCPDITHRATLQTQNIFLIEYDGK